MDNLNYFRISNIVARDKNIPTFFLAKVLIETQKAVYVYGKGELDPTGRCARCGRELTHPGSILIGIGPECLGSWSAREIKLDNITPAEAEQLRQLVREQIVDTWLPKGCLKSMRPADSSCSITVPPDHPVLTPRSKVERKALITKMNGQVVLKITFPYNKTDLDNIKAIPGRRFHNDGASRYWTCPPVKGNIELLKYWGFSISGGETSSAPQVENPGRKEVTEIPGLLQGPEGTGLMPFQIKGVSFIEGRNGNAIIGDEMGLGKTAQALAWLQLHPEKRPAIIVVPASLKLNWEREAKMWLPNPKVQILSGTNPDLPIRGDILIINYDILPAWTSYLQQLAPQVIVIDECHYIKNNQANRTKAVKTLAKGIPHILPLSGTPIINRPVEFFNSLKLVDVEGELPNFWRYAQRYCGARHNGFGWDFSGSSNTEELHQKVGSFMLRRVKAEVLPELPEKRRSFLPLELDNRSDYQKAENDFILWMEKTKGKEAAEKVKGAEVLTKIEILKQLAVSGKLNQVVSWIRDFLETGEKLVVFAVHHFVIDALMKEFSKEAVKVDGSVTREKRDQAVQRFQDDATCRLFIGNIKAAGVGLTLTAASNLAVVELPWTPGDLIQAEDRCHRIGQKNTVNIHYLLAERSIETKISLLLDKKHKILNSVLDGKTEEEDGLLTELIKLYNEKENEQ